MKYVSCLVAFGLVAGCVSQGEISQRPAEISFNLDANYQAVYARTLSSMRKCLRPGTSFFPNPATVEVEAQLYPDLGYGEIIHGLTGLAPGAISATRIERKGAGAKVEIRTANQTARSADNTRLWQEYWAKGGTNCATLGSFNPPAL